MGVHNISFLPLYRFTAFSKKAVPKTFKATLYRTFNATFDATFKKSGKVAKWQSGIT
jgi:hypothetical protein